MAHFCAKHGSGAPLPARAPVPQAEGGGPQTEKRIAKVPKRRPTTRMGTLVWARLDALRCRRGWKNPPTQQELADRLGTNGGGTRTLAWSRKLNDRLGTNYYENKLIPGQTATDEERLLWKDIVTDIDKKLSDRRQHRRTARQSSQWLSRR